MKCAPTAPDFQAVNFSDKSSRDWVLTGRAFNVIWFLLLDFLHFFMSAFLWIARACKPVLMVLALAFFLLPDARAQVCATQGSYTIEPDSSTIRCGSTIVLKGSPQAGGGDSYVIKWGDGQMTAGTGSFPINVGAKTHAYHRAGTFTITLVRTFATPCKDSATTLITVNSARPTPTLALTGAACSDSVRLSAGGLTLGDSVVWFRNGVRFGKTLGGNLRFAQAVGTYRFAAGILAGGCLSDTAGLTAVVKQTPALPVVTVSSACGGTATSFTVTNAQPGASYIFDVGHGGNRVTGASSSYTYPAVTGNGTDSYTLRAWAVAEGCTSAVATQAVVVKQVPSVELANAFAVTLSRFSNCTAFRRANPSFPITAYNASTTNNIGYEFSWGDATPNTVLTDFSNPVTHTYTTEGVFTLTVKVTGQNGCVSSKQYPVLNISNPAMGLSNPGNTINLCTPVRIGYLLSDTTYSNHSSTVYTITWGDGKDTVLTHAQLPASKTLFHTWDTTSCNAPDGKFEISFKAENACNRTNGRIDGAITLAKPRARFTLSQNEICVGSTVTLTNRSRNGYSEDCVRNTVYRVFWGDGTSTLNFVETGNMASLTRTKIYSSPGKYKVVLTALSETCGADSIADSICVSPPPVVSYKTTIPGGVTGSCTGNPVSFQNTTNLVGLTCGKPVFTWSFTTTDNYAGCGSSGDAVSYTNGTSATSVNPRVIFNLPGTYRVRLSVTNPCSSVTKDTLIVIKGRPSISLSGVQNICVGQSISPTATVGNCSASSAITYTWKQNGVVIGNSATIAARTYNTPGTFSIRLVAQNECGRDSVTQTFTVFPSPQITAQPDNLTICQGGGGSMTITAATTAVPNSITYSWLVSTNGGSTWSTVSNNTNYTGATTATLNFVNAPLSFNNNRYRAVATGASGCADTSQARTLNIDALPTVTNPTSPSICSGQTDSLAVNATGTNLTFQWQLSTNSGGNWTNLTNGTSYDGATTRALKLLNASTAISGYQYRLVVTNGANCQRISGVATVTVNVGPVAVNHPDDRTTCVGGNVQFSASFTPATGVNRQWQRLIGSTWTDVPNTAPFSLVNSNNLNINAAPLSLNGTRFRLKATNNSNGCPAYSNEATLTVNALPTVTTPPANRTVCEGTTAGFKVITAASPAVTTYQWQMSTGSNFNDINDNSTYTGTNTDSLTVNGVTATLNNRQYRVVVTTGSGCSFTSPAARLNVVSLPVINNQPGNQSICDGGNATFSVTMAGSNFNYQWQEKLGAAAFADLTNTGIYSGTSTATLIISGVPASFTGRQYRVVVTSAGTPIPCSVTSSVANLSVGNAVTLTAKSDTVCSGQPLVIAPVFPVVGTRFNISQATANASISGFVAAGNQITSTQTLTNSSASWQSVTLRLVPVFNGCSGQPVDVLVWVKPLPVLSASSSQFDYCQSGTVSVNLSSNVSSGLISYSTALISSSNVSGASSPGAGSSYSQALTNVVDSLPGTAVYRSTVTVDGCQSAPVDITVNISPRPRLRTPADTIEICGGQPFAIPLAASVPGSAYSWTFTNSSPAISGASAGTNKSVTQITGTLANSGAATGTVTYTITPSNNGCAGASKTVIVKVKPLPVVQLAANSASACRSLNVNLALANNVGAGTYSWTVQTTGSISGATDGTGGSIIHNLTNNSNSQPASATYRIKAAVNGCEGPEAVYTVTLAPKPALLNPPTNHSICNNQAVNLQLSNSVSGGTFTWRPVANPAITGAANGSGTTINDMLVSSSVTSVLTQVYKVVPVAGGCQGDTVLISVNVSPSPTITATAVRPVICSGQRAVVRFTSTVTGTIFNWTVVSTSGGISGAVAGTGDSISHTLTNTGITIGQVVYRVSPSLGGNCGGSYVDVTVDVKPLPAVAPMPTQVFCGSGTALFNLSSSISGTSYSWTVPANNLGATAGIGSTINQLLTNSSTSNDDSVAYTITPIANGCTGSPVTVWAVVRAVPVVTISQKPDSICSGNAAQINFNSSVTGSSFIWTATGNAGISGFATSGTGNSITHTLINASTTVAGTVSYAIRAIAKGCTSAVVNVVVKVNPRPDFAIANSAPSFCQSETTNITLSSSTPGTTYSWTVVSTNHVSGAQAGAGSSINQLLQNTGDSAIGQATYRITPSSRGCTGSAKDVTVVVFPKPTASATTSSGSICSGTQAIISLGSTTANSTFRWFSRASSGTTGHSAGNGSGPIVQTLNNPSDNANSFVTYKVVTEANGCVSDTVSVTINVLPRPTFDVQPADTSLCGSGTINYRFASSASGLTYRWLVNTQGPVSGATAGNGPALVQHLMNTSSDSSAIVTYTVFPVVSGCEGSPQLVRVTVRPVPVLTINAASVAICSGTATSIALSSSVRDAYSSFSWQVDSVSPGISGAAPGTGSLISQVLTNASHATLGFVRYRVITISSGCTSSAGVITITVNPLPKVLAAKQSICSDDSTSLPLNATVSGGSFRWQIASVQGNITGQSAGQGSTIRQQLINPSDSTAGYVTYRIWATANGCEGSDTAITVEVRPRARVSYSPASVAFCVTGQADFRLTPSIAGVPVVWQAMNRGPVTGASSGAGLHINQPLTNLSRTEIGYVHYIVSAEVNGCPGQIDTIKVQVNPRPLAQFEVRPDTTYCVNQPLTFRNLTPSITGSSLSYQWSFGNGANSQSVDGQVSYSTIGRYLVRLIATSAEGCADTSWRWIRVVDPPVAAFSKTNPGSNCSPVQLTFTNTSYQPDFDAEPQWAWNFGNGQTSALRTPPAITFAGSVNQDTTYYISLTVIGRCGVSIYRDSIQVLPQPLAGLLIESDTVCARLPVRIANTSRGLPTHYLWSFGDGTRDSVLRDNRTMLHSFQHFGTGDTTFTVRIIAYNNCGADTATQTVIVKPNSVYAFFNTDADEGCSPLTVRFISNQTGFNNVVWNWGDGNQETGGFIRTKTFTNSTNAPITYRVYLYAFSGKCARDTFYKDIVVHPLPQVSFRTNQRTYCLGDTVRFTNMSAPGVSAAWSFGDNTSSNLVNPPFKIYTAPGRYRISLTGTSTNGTNCTRTIVDSLTILPTPIVKAQYVIDTVRGCQPLRITFRMATPGAQSWRFHFGDGNTVANQQVVTYTYNSAGTFQPSLVVTGACNRDSAGLPPITVHPLPLVSFSTSKRSYCLNDTVRFTNTSAAGISARWNFGDNTTSSLANPPEKIYTSPGTYIITLTGTTTNGTGCTRTFIDSVTILPTPIVKARFTVDTLRGCQPLRVTFRLLTQGAQSWRFNLGDGNTVANQTTVTYTYANAGTFNPSLVVTGACNRDSAALPAITVYAGPQVRFITNKTSYCQGDTIRLINQSQLPLGFSWVFSNGAGSTLQSPLPIVLADTGLFTITLTGRSLTAPFCPTVYTLTVSVRPKPVARFAGPGGVVLQACQGQVVNFSNLSTNGSQYLWNFGVAGATSLQTSPSYTYKGSGLYKVHLTVYSPYGCVDTTSRFVNVYPAPAPQFTVSDTAGCSPLTVNFTNQTSYPNPLQGNLSWSFGNGLLFNGHFNVPPQTYINTTAQVQTYRVVLYATTTFGCKDSAVKTITVYPRPQPAFNIVRDTLFQDSATFTFLNRTRPVINWSYQWKWGDGADTLVQDTLPVLHRYLTPGRYRVTLIASSPHGCLDSVTRQVVVRPVIPRPAFTIEQGDTVYGCRPLTIYVRNNTRYGQDYLWNFGNGVVYNIADPPPVTYYNAGRFSIKLVARNAAGADSLVRNQIIIVEEKPNAAFVVNTEQIVLPGQAARFTNLSRGAVSYLWDFGDGRTSREVNPVHNYTDTGRYDVRLIAYTRGGCADTFAIKQAVAARYDGRIVIPNAFTPFSTNGLNDTFRPEMDGAIEYRMLIFSRWGEIMFESRDPNQGWDGRHRGVMCTPDQYVYRIEVTFSNGVSKTETGKVLLLR